MINIAVFVSGGGTNLQALIDNIENGKIKNGKIVIVLSSKENVYALERAKRHQIPSIVISRKNYIYSDGFDSAILKVMKDNKIDLIVMAGFLSIIGKSIVDTYPNKIINIHPSLIPAFCGAGYYGLKVHEGALKRGIKYTGATVHFVNEIPDGGPIILQKPIKIRNNDTPETLQKRVMKQAEWKILPEAVNLFCEGKLIIENDKVIIKNS